MLTWTAHLATAALSLEFALPASTEMKLESGQDKSEKKLNTHKAKKENAYEKKESDDLMQRRATDCQPGSKNDKHSGSGVPGGL